MSINNFMERLISTRSGVRDITGNAITKNRIQLPIIKAVGINLWERRGLSAAILCITAFLFVGKCASSTDDPILIRTYEDLKRIATITDGLQGHYRLANDIDAQDSWSEDDGSASNCTPYDGANGATATCQGFTPIGSGPSSAFTGSFDGGSYAILDLYIKRDATYVGLFGYIGSGAKIENLGVQGGDVSSSSSSSNSYAGGLVGYNNGGSITNSYATGKVSSSSSSSYSVAGGLVGINGGTITNSYATGKVSSSSSSSINSVAGGLVGYDNGGSITNSYATGKVSSSSSSSSNSYAGGLVGYNLEGGITNSYATGDATATATGGGGSIAGGLVGNNSGGSITNSYATGKVSSSSSSYAGGLVGENR